MRQRRPARVANAIPQRPFGQVPRAYEPIKVISDDQVEAIHQAALRLLATQGMRVLNGRALDLFRQGLRRFRHDRSDARAVELKAALVHATPRRSLELVSTLLSSHSIQSSYVLRSRPSN